jgi:hypothetical protein
MTTMIRSLSPFGPLILLSLALSAFLSSYAMLGTPPSDLAIQLLSFAMAVFVILWAQADARRRRCVPCFDFGFLLLLSFPIGLIWYVFWTRRVRGLLLLGALVALVYVPWLLAALVWTVLTALRVH